MTNTNAFLFIAHLVMLASDSTPTRFRLGRKVSLSHSPALEFLPEPSQKISTPQQSLGNIESQEVVVPVAVNKVQVTPDGRFVAEACETDRPVSFYEWSNTCLSSDHVSHTSSVPAVTVMMVFMPLQVTTVEWYPFGMPEVCV